MAVRRRVQFATEGPSLTKQADRHGTDVREIMKRYQKTRDPSLLGFNRGNFMDVSMVGSYQECLDLVQEAQAAFMSLPAAVRDRFGNNPALLIAATLDPEMHEELEELGVLTPTKKEATTPEKAPEKAPEKPTEKEKA